MDLLHQIANEHPRPLLFATISGAHLYGFPSPDSDYDLRGAHMASPQEVLGLREPKETIDRTSIREGVEIDLVTHDVRKFFRLVLKRNGYVLEQILSPLVVRTTPEHEELIALTDGCLTKHHVHHYIGFARNQWDLFLKEDPPRVKPLLYVYRVLLTGIHLMRAGKVNANLIELNEEARLPQIPDLVAAKTGGPEKGTLKAADLAFHTSEFERLIAELEAAGEATTLPEVPSARDAMEDLLLRVRRQSLKAWVAGTG